jgi:hypothetical protein
MTDFETALDDCLQRLNRGEADVRACLRSYPEHAADLRPLLQAASRVRQGQHLEPSPAFVAATRAKVVQHARAHPRRVRRPMIWSRFSLLQRAAVVAALLVALLLSGTAYAQGAMPGDTMYPWKLASENVIRVFDPVRVDLWISQRRAREVLAVRHDPIRLAVAWAQYRLVMDRLLAYNDPQVNEEIAAVLRQEWEQFALYGVPLPQATVLPSPTATVTATSTASAAATTLLPTLPLASSMPNSGPTLTPGPTSTPFVLPTFPPPPPPPTLLPTPTSPIPTVTILPTIPPTLLPTPTSPIPTVTILPTIPPLPCPFPPPICP